MGSFRLLSLVDSLIWDHYFKRLPYNQQDIYYTPEYYSIYDESYGKGVCFVFEKGNDVALYPFFLNSTESLPYELDAVYYDIQGAYGYNGVISSNYNRDFINEFYKALNSYCVENNVIAEFTRFNPLLRNYMFSVNHIEVSFDRHTVSLDISKDFKDIWAEEYTSRNRNMISKAKKNNLRVINSSDIESFYNFYDMYIHTMNNVKAADYYYFSKDYFRRIYEFLNEKYFLLFSRFNTEFAGGILLLTNGIYTHYHLSARNLKYGKYAINNHLLNEAVILAKEQGNKFFHFGGGNNSRDDDSLYKFKCNFSKSREKFFIGKKIHNLEVYCQIVDQWKDKFPKSYQTNKQKILGYREI